MIDRAKIIAKIEKSIESKEIIPADEIKEWMESGDIEVMAATHYILWQYDYLIKPSVPNPPLSIDTICNFNLRYFKRCILENPNPLETLKEGYTHSRYISGADLVKWFKFIWYDKRFSRSFIKDLKDMITQIYNTGDRDIKECVITGILEHLFEDAEITEYFADWKEDPELKVAYDQALEWGIDHRGDKQTY